MRLSVVSIQLQPSSYLENLHDYLQMLIITKLKGGARGVVIIVAGNGHGDTSSNPERDWLHFT